MTNNLNADISLFSLGDVQHSVFGLFDNKDFKSVTGFGCPSIRFLSGEKSFAG